MGSGLCRPTNYIHIDCDENSNIKGIKIDGCFYNKPLQLSFNKLYTQKISKTHHNKSSKVVPKLNENVNTNENANANTSSTTQDNMKIVPCN